LRTYMYRQNRKTKVSRMLCGKRSLIVERKIYTRRETPGLAMHLLNIKRLNIE
jgi:hypothetical protein